MPGQLPDHTAVFAERNQTMRILGTEDSFDLFDQLYVARLARNHLEANRLTVLSFETADRGRYACTEGSARQGVILKGRHPLGILAFDMSVLVVDQMKLPKASERHTNHGKTKATRQIVEYSIAKVEPMGGLMADSKEAQATIYSVDESQYQEQTMAQPSWF